MKRNKKFILGVVIVILLIPACLFVSYASYCKLSNRYVLHKLHQVTPDAVKYDALCREIDNTAYTTYFYKFSIYNENLTEGWYTEINNDYVYKECWIDLGILVYKIRVSPGTNEAWVDEYFKSSIKYKGMIR